MPCRKGIITWATLARYLGFGMAHSVANEMNWTDVRTEMTAMMTLYLSTRAD
jgi:hypothetical protein